MSDRLFQRVEGRNPGVIGKLRFFEYKHLADPRLQAFSAHFARLAQQLLDTLPDDPELTIALDKLREVKDRAVALAATLYCDPGQDGEVQ